MLQETQSLPCVSGHCDAPRQSVWTDFPGALIYTGLVSSQNEFTGSPRWKKG